MKQSIEELVEEYGRRIERAANELRTVQRDIARTSLLRLLLVVGGIGVAVWFRGCGWGTVLGIVAATLAAFMVLVWFHNQLYGRKAWLEQVVEVNRQEQAALAYDSSAFDDGAEYTDPAHLYALDLDVYGPRSLFQYLNRTCTASGRRTLAAWLGRHLEEAEAIKARQAAVRELAEAIDFRQDFRVRGRVTPGANDDEARLQAWVESPSLFVGHRKYRCLPPLVTGANLVCLLLTALGLLPGTLWASLLALVVIGSYTFSRKISKLQEFYERRLHILGTYADQLRYIGELPVEAPLLKALKERAGGGKHQAAKSIAELRRLMHALDQRNNIFMYALLNGCFFWELHQIMRIEAWKEKHGSELLQWLEALGEVDALCSLGAFAYNHPGYVYPTLVAGTGFCYRAKELGHPLMHRDRCVRNDLDMSRRPAFIIVTGANMAGKSTYLRTVGINFLLACIGAPVCAREMELTPVRLVTSLRTTDSLCDNESYFFAELKRLKVIIDRLQAGERLFIILDEILKGTNSVDKQAGSMALVRQLLTLQSNGVIATHDLQLGSLADTFSEDVRNFCFEADIRGDELTFSYRMRPGVARNMNACFLMQKMGIAVTPRDTSPQTQR